MAQRQKNTRQQLLLAGIEEINTQGIAGFSIRRVAEKCGVSCAAPYKHFKDKREFIAAIIDYVNSLWAQRQREILARCPRDLRSQIVEVCVEYVKFLMENPFLRSILLLKDEHYDNLYHKPRGHMNSVSQQLEQAYFAASGMDPAVQSRKLQLVRSLIFGSMFLFDTGEIPYNEESIRNLRSQIDREFDLP